MVSPVLGAEEGEGNSGWRIRRRKSIVTGRDQERERMRRKKQVDGWIDGEEGQYCLVPAATQPSG